MSDWAAKRFWKETTSDRVDGGFTVHLDGRPVRTPAKTPVIVPTLAMADAMRLEWDAQVEKINPLSMPVTRAANAALDKVSTQHGEVVDMLAAYGDSDLLCYRAESPEELVAKQAAGWDPLIDWAATDLGAPLKLRTGIMHKPQDPETLASLHGHVSVLDAFHLTAFHDLVAITGSLVLGLAVTRGRLDAAQAWDLSRIDEEWQIAQWGRDDDADAQSDLKRQDLLRAADFYKLSA